MNFSLQVAGRGPYVIGHRVDSHRCQCPLDAGQTLSVAPAIPLSINRLYRGRGRAHGRDRDHGHRPDDRSLGHIQPIEQSRPADYTHDTRDNACASSGRVQAVRASTPAAAGRIVVRSTWAVHTRPVAVRRSPTELAHRYPVPLAPTE